MPVIQNSLVSRFLSRIQRAMGARPPRYAAVNLGGMPGMDMARTTAYDPRTARQQRANAAASLFGEAAYEQTRIQRYQDYREIVEEVPELSRALEVFVDFVFGQRADHSFGVYFAPNARPQVRQVVTDAQRALGLEALIRGVIHEGKWLGDSFSELIYAPNPDRLAGQRHLLPEQVRVMQDDWGQLEHYEWSPVEYSDPRILIPFQVLHYAPSAVRGARYGRSLFHSARTLRRGHEAIDQVCQMLCLRKAAGDTFWLWPFPSGATDAQIDQWIQHAQQSVDTENYFEQGGQLRKRVASFLDVVPKILPFRVIDKETETKPTPVEMRPANLSQLVEVLRHYQDRFFVATGIPKAFVGLERDVNSRATLEQQGLYFAMTIRQCQHEAARLAADVLTRACLAAGISPNEDEFFVEMPEVSAFDESMRAQVLINRSQASLALVNSGVPVESALKLCFDLDDDDVENLMPDGPMMDTPMGRGNMDPTGSDQSDGPDEAAVEAAFREAVELYRRKLNGRAYPRPANVQLPPPA